MNMFARFNENPAMIIQNYFFWTKLLHAYVQYVNIV